MSSERTKTKGKGRATARNASNAVDLARLESMSLAAIRDLWRALGGRRSRRGGETGAGGEAGGGGVPRRVMIRDIAYRAQIRRWGGLDRTTERLLKYAIKDAIANARISELSGNASDLAARDDATGHEPTVPSNGVRRPRTTSPALPAGAKLIRVWRGRTHEVTVVQGGKAFVYQGKTYRSLSSIATEITGMVWSGPQFFGVVNRKGKRTTRGSTSGREGASI